MKKKILLLLNFILLAGCAAIFILAPGRSDALSCPVADEGELKRVQTELVETKEDILSDLRFNQVTLVKDVESGTFYLPLDMDSSRWETGEITSGQPDVRLLFSEAIGAKDKQSAIREGTAFSFLAVRGDVYRSYSLVFTGLPIVSVEADATPDTEIFGGTIRFWEADSKKDWFYSNILEAHIRGNTSRIYPKKGYKISLKKENNTGSVVEDKRALFGLREDDEYMLNALYTDSSKIRDALCADIWSGIGGTVERYPDMYLGTRMTYVELFFNGEYRGLYALMEPVDSKQLDLTKELDRGTVEYSYKASTPQLIETEAFAQSETWTEEMAGYKLKGTYAQIEKEQWQPLLDYLTWKESEDETFMAGASDAVDPENLMKVWVYLQAVMGIDNRGKNMFYVAKYEDKAYRMYLAPWDMDLSLGDTLQEVFDSEYPWGVGLNALIYRERINFEPGDRMVRLDAAGARSHVTEIWTDARKTVLSNDYLQQAIDRYSALVRDSGALERDGDRWPESMQGADYEKLKLLTCYRMEFLDQFFYDNVEAYLSLGYS